MFSGIQNFCWEESGVKIQGNDLTECSKKVTELPKGSWADQSDEICMEYVTGTNTEMTETKAPCTSDYCKLGDSRYFFLSFCPCLCSSDLYCTLEVDSFGYFVNKAKTRVYRDTTEPNWNEVGLIFLDVTCSMCQTSTHDGQKTCQCGRLLHAQHLCCTCCFSENTFLPGLFGCQGLQKVFSWISCS